MFYTMNRTLMFAAASLILVGAIVTIAMSNAIYAFPPKTVVEYCVKTKTKGFGPCYPTEAECLLHLVNKNDNCHAKRV